MTSSDPRLPRAPRTTRAIAAAAAGIAAATALALLAGCGQRGPLYLPDSQPGKKLAADPQVPPPPAAPHR